MACPIPLSPPVTTAALPSSPIPRRLLISTLDNCVALRDARWCTAPNHSEGEQPHRQRDDRHGPEDRRQAEPGVFLQRTDPERCESIPDLVEGDQESRE